MVKSPLSLYFHIPFCTRKCPYCHFYVIPNHPKQQEALLEGFLLEWKNILPKVSQHEIISIYFGGGTPTLFESKHLHTLLSTIQKQASIAPNCEITLEANPEDVSLKKMQTFQKIGINRVSIGVQSFEDSSLKVLERIHTAKKAMEAIENTFNAGIQNISIDLMYELPKQSLGSFEKTLLHLEKLPISHLSLYNLTIEPHTPFFKRKLDMPSHEEGYAMLQTATSHLEKIGFKRYEISAFAKNEKISLHNTGYWTARPFFGLGPSAFSYYEEKRFRNHANIHKYLKAFKEKKSPIDFSEKLPYPQNVCERFAIHLRLLEGANLQKFSLPKNTLLCLDQLIQNGYLIRKNHQIQLSKKGLLFYDTVASYII